MGEKSDTRGKMNCTLCHADSSKSDPCKPFVQSVLQSPERL